ncbi:hypothetical protein [Aurantiacibacter sp. MUD61]|nr:hypothetical protein [Aurantiacibacter sp. MUD61]
MSEAKKKTGNIWTTPQVTELALDAEDIASTAGTTTPDFSTTAS